MQRITGIVYNKSMKKRIVFLLGLLILFLLFTVPGRRLLVAAEFYLFYDINEGGLYDPALREYYCTDSHTCRHEEGHKQDHALGWFSETAEFDGIVKVLKDCYASGLSQLPVIRFVLESDESDKELYANLYRSVNLGEYETLNDLLFDYVDKCK